MYDYANQIIDSFKEATGQQHKFEEDLRKIVTDT